ncbi:hypothetical protein [Spirillospora sp. CA-294931]|uniref:hypothetical protein n=1 Tax=Spirillospora sp. CA-294931 TaxID=3240042 RepID=UPI003D8D7654
MTAKDSQTPVEPDEETEETLAETPKPKRKRRVRVIEVIDDEDLDDVLEAIEQEEEEEKPKKKPLPEVNKKEPEPSAASPLQGNPKNMAILAVILIALFASLAVWQWRTAASEASKTSDRESVSKAAAAYGDVSFNYNASNYQAQMTKAQEVMGGDLLESYKTNTVPNMGKMFTENPQINLSSKTNQVFVGNVDGKFATAVISVDINATLKAGQAPVAQPASLIRLALAKIKGKWLVTQMYASGQKDGAQNQAPLPTVPSPTPTQKPKN